MYLAGMIYLLVKSTPLIHSALGLLMDLFGLARSAYAPREVSFTTGKLMCLILYMILPLVVFFCYPVLRKRWKAQNISGNRIAVSIFIGCLLFASLYFSQVATNYLAVPHESLDRKGWVWNGFTKTLVDVNRASSFWDDETLYLTTARELSRIGIRNYFKLYGNPEFTEHERAVVNRALEIHPPLHFIILSLCGQNYVAMRYTNTILYALATCLVFLVVGEIYGDRNGITSALLFFSIPYLFRKEAVWANNDLLVTVLVLGALYLAVRATRIGPGRSMVCAAASGLLLGLALLAKYTAIFALAGFVVFWFWLSMKREHKFYYHLLLQIGACLVVFLPWIVAAYGTEIGTQHYHRYAGIFAKGVSAQRYTQARTFGGKRGIVTFLVLLPHWLGPPLFLLFSWGLAVTIGKHVRRWWKERSLKIFPLYWLGIYVTGVLLVNPLLRYLMAGVFVMAALAALGLESMRDRRAAAFALSTCFAFFVSKILLDMVEYSPEMFALHISGG